ncbi:VOC family protein [Streptomyces sp. NPDC059455]|uniref:VOC family protein n=1 Tax=Streptomyces sp. NPDC059455 TaxID=3346837 RepID=UPI0036BC92CC
MHRLCHALGRKGGRPIELQAKQLTTPGPSGLWVETSRRDVIAYQAETTRLHDLDDILARLAAHGIDHEPVETYSNGVRHVVVLDPDGNSLSLAEAPAR